MTTDDLRSLGSLAQSPPLGVVLLVLGTILFRLLDLRILYLVAGIEGFDHARKERPSMVAEKPTTGPSQAIKGNTDDDERGHADNGGASYLLVQGSTSQGARCIVHVPWR